MVLYPWRAPLRHGSRHAQRSCFQVRAQPIPMIKFSTEPHGVDRSRIQVCINQAQPDALRPPGRRLSDRRRESHCVRGGGICTWAPARFLSTRRRAPRRMSGLPATNRAWRVGQTSADTRHWVARWRSQTTAVHAGCTALRRLYARMPHWSTRPSRPVLGCRLVRTVVLQVVGMYCTVHTYHEDLHRPHALLHRIRHD